MPCHLTSQWAVYAGTLAWHRCKRANHVKAQYLDKCQRLGGICMQIQPLFLFFRVTSSLKFPLREPLCVSRFLSEVSGEPSAPRKNWQHDRFSRDQMRFKRSDLCHKQRRGSRARVLAGCGIVTCSGAQCFGVPWSAGGFKGQLTGGPPADDMDQRQKLWRLRGATSYKQEALALFFFSFYSNNDFQLRY